MGGKNNQWEAEMEAGRTARHRAGQWEAETGRAGGRRAPDPGGEPGKQWGLGAGLSTCQIHFGTK